MEQGAAAMVGTDGEKNGTVKNEIQKMEDHLPVKIYTVQSMQIFNEMFSPFCCICVYDVYKPTQPD